MTAGRQQILDRVRVKDRRLRRPTILRGKRRFPGSRLSQRAATETRDDRCSSFNRSKENRKSRHNVRSVPRGRPNSRRDSE